VCDDVASIVHQSLHNGEALPPAGSFVGIACRLAATRLLLADPGRKRAAQRVSLNVGYGLIDMDRHVMGCYATQ
jgi:hypothetical protein